MKLGEHVSFAEIADGMALLDERTGEYWTLNSTAALVVEDLLNGGTEATAIDRLSREYDVDRTALSSDIRDLLDELRGAGLVDG